MRLCPDGKWREKGDQRKASETQCGTGLCGTEIYAVWHCWQRPDGRWREKGGQHKASETQRGMPCGTVGRALMGIGVIGGLILGIRDGRLRPVAFA